MFINDYWVDLGGLFGTENVSTTGDIESRSLILSGDVGVGVNSKTTLTGVTESPATDPGWTLSSSTDMTAPDGYAKGYIGTLPVVFPYWLA
jgi:hypothetical protein